MSTEDTPDAWLFTDATGTHVSLTAPSSHGWPFHTQKPLYTVNPVDNVRADRGTLFDRLLSEASIEVDAERGTVTVQTYGMDVNPDEVALLSKAQAKQAERRRLEMEARKADM